MEILVRQPSPRKWYDLVCLICKEEFKSVRPNKVYCHKKPCWYKYQQVLDREERPQELKMLEIEKRPAPALSLGEIERLEILEIRRKELRRKLRRAERIYTAIPTDGLSNQMAVLTSQLRVLG